MLILLAFCIAATVLKYLVIALGLALLVAIVWGACTNPLETVGVLAFAVLANLMIDHEVATLTVITFLGLLVVLRRPTKTAPTVEGATPPTNTNVTGNDST